jgi:hypothetical protein
LPVADKYFLFFHINTQIFIANPCTPSHYQVLYLMRKIRSKPHRHSDLPV